MDRKSAVMRQNPGAHYVALRKESVDRKFIILLGEFV